VQLVWCLPVIDRYLQYIPGVNAVIRAISTHTCFMYRPIMLHPFYRWSQRHVFSLSVRGACVRRSCVDVYKKDSGSPYSITERRVPELIPVLGSQPAGCVSHKPGGRLPLLSARPAVTPEGCYQFCCLLNRGTMGVNSLPKTVTRQRRGCDLNPGPSAPESSTITTRIPSHPSMSIVLINSVLIYT